VQFTYRAKQDTKTEASGVIEAIDLPSAVAHLKQMGLYPLEVVPLEVPQGPTPSGFSPQPFSRRELAHWARTVGQGIKAGLSLTHALHLLAEQEHRRKVGQAAKILEEKVTAGMSLADAMAQLGNTFSSVAISLARAGEAGGALEEVLEALANQMEVEAELVSKVRDALIYPAVVLTAALGVVIFLTRVVFPSLSVFFSEMGQPIPWFTQLVIQLSRWLSWGIGSGVLLLLAGFAVKGQQFRTLVLRVGIRLVAGLPFFGQLVNQAEIARLSSTLGLLLSHGLPLPQALRLGADTVSQATLRSQVKQAQGAVMEGMNLSVALQRTGVKEPFLVTMISMAEVQGDLARAFQQAGARFHQEVDRRIRVLSTLIEPAMILVVGVMVGLIVFSMLLPIFQINFTVG